MTPWSRQDIIDLVSDGSAGPDGTAAEFYLSLHDDSIEALLVLLQLADEGHLPLFWREARVALIPKPDAPL